MSEAEEQIAFVQIKKVLYDQQAAWNKADIDAFMQGYLKTEDLSFVGKSGITKGWQKTLENYQKGYPNADAMGQLKFDILELKALSKDHCIMHGRFTLIRKEDKPTGYFTLIWQKVDGQWLITTDHTSG